MPTTQSGATTSADIQIAAREVDFVTRFAKTWDELRALIGIMRPIRRAPGTKLISKYAELKLQSGSVGEGQTIPYSQAKVRSKEYATLSVEKYAKAVTLESILEHGYDTAVQMTDAQWLTELQDDILDRLYAYMWTGTLTSHELTFQQALAMAQGRVRNRWKEMRRSTTNIVGFCNLLDAYAYLGSTPITVQDQFGLNYVKDFMGYGTLFLLSDREIPRGNVLATPVENLALYYVDPSSSDFVRAGLEFRTDGEAGLIGFHAKGNYGTAVSEAFALMGVTMFAEYLDGIAIVDFGTEFDPVTVAAEEGTTELSGHTVSDLQSDVTVADGKISGTLRYISSGSLPALYGAGNFLALKFSDMSTETGVSVRVGVVPSQTMDPITLDANKNAVLKVSNKDTQKLRVITTDGTYNKVQVLDLSGLTLEEA